MQEILETETPLRSPVRRNGLRFHPGYQFLTLTPQLLVLNTESAAIPSWSS